MSTRSTIATKMPDGRYKAIYCHWDGYLSHNGRILLEHYNSQEGAELVVSVGDLSSLGASMACPTGHSYATPANGCSVAYGRDRGEKGIEAKVFDTIEARNEFRQQYNYTWAGNRWLVDGLPLRLLMCARTPTTATDHAATGHQP